MRLIDADEVRLQKGFFEKVTSVPKFYEWLDSLPTVDVEPVRHGKWISIHGWIHCSVCDREPPNETNLETDYCPNCGTRMDAVAKSL